VPEETAVVPETEAGQPDKPKESALWREIKGLFWVLLAVLAFHSFVAKPFYIPSESMMPVLLKGDRLVVSKYPYGWSWVSPSFHVLPHWNGRFLGKMPKRGDIVIITPPQSSEDYIKRVIGLPGDTIEVRGGSSGTDNAALIGSAGNQTISATGIVIAGISVLRQVCRNTKITSTTRAIASTSVISTSRIDSWTTSVVLNATW